MSGRLSNITELVVRPVGIGRFFTGHVIMISRMLPSPNCWERSSNKSEEHLFRQNLPERGVKFVILMFSIPSMKTSPCRYQSSQETCFVLAAPWPDSTLRDISCPNFPDHHLLLLR